jgi:hypothetical protein
MESGIAVTVAPELKILVQSAIISNSPNLNSAEVVVIN